MASSARFEKLEANLRALRRELLPKSLLPVASYRPEWHTRASAYRVLAHAEIESYLEDRAKDLVVSALRDWQRKSRVRRVLIALLAFVERDVAAPPATLQPPQANQAKAWPELIELDKRIDRCANAYFAWVQKNHGIKEANLLTLLLPIGYPTSSLDPAWLAQMNSFGAARGEVAHSSRLQMAFDPKTEFDAVGRILTFLGKVDSDLNKLAKS
jgi:hypothetical protein